MGGATLDLETTMKEPEYKERDRNWPPEKFDKRKHSQFARVWQVFAYDSLNKRWGYYHVGGLRDVPTYLDPSGP